MTESPPRYGLRLIGAAALIGMAVIVWQFFDGRSVGPDDPATRDQLSAEDASGRDANEARGDSDTRRSATNDPAPDADSPAGELGTWLLPRLIRCKELEDYWALSRETSQTFDAETISRAQLATHLVDDTAARADDSDLTELYRAVLLQAGIDREGPGRFAERLCALPSIPLQLCEWTVTNAPQQALQESLASRGVLELAAFLPEHILQSNATRQAIGAIDAASESWSPERLAGWLCARAVFGDSNAIAAGTQAVSSETLAGRPLPETLRRQLIAALPDSFMAERVASMTHRLQAGESSPLPFRRLMHDLVLLEDQQIAPDLRTRAFEAGRHVPGMQNLGLACVLRDAEALPNPAESALPTLAALPLYRTTSALLELPRDSQVRWFFLLGSLTAEGPHREFVENLQRALCHRTQRFVASRFVERPDARELAYVNASDLTMPAAGIASEGPASAAELLRSVLSALGSSLVGQPRSGATTLDLGRVPDLPESGSLTESEAAEFTAIAAAATALYELSRPDEYQLRGILLGSAVEKLHLGRFLGYVLDDLERKGALTGFHDELRLLALRSVDPDVRSKAIVLYFEHAPDAASAASFLPTVVRSLNEATVGGLIQALPTLASSGVLAREDRLQLLGSVLRHPEQEVRFNAVLALTDVLPGLSPSRDEARELLAQADASLETEQDEDVRYWLERYRTQLLEIANSH